MAKLNQILAVEKGVRQRTYANLTELDRQVQKEQLHTGIARNYRPKDDEGEKLPPERSLVQVNTREILEGVKRNMSESWDVTATKEWANQSASADLVLPDGTTVLKDVPVGYLLFLEKQLTDLKTLVGRLPILDPGVKWLWDNSAMAYASEPQETHRTKKVHRPFVKYDATPEHPAQVDVVTEDEIVGFWETTRFSGAMPVQERVDLFERIETALNAVKQAREAANDMVVVNQSAGTALLEHLLA